MCERYVIPDQTEVERQYSVVHPWWRFAPSFNVAPERNVPVIRLHEGETEGVIMRWGLIPEWAEGDASKGNATHAPADELEHAKLFREAWVKGQRCILPAAGFYGWQLTPAGYRQPFFCRPVNPMVFGLAALWDKSVTEEDDFVIEGCALITVPPNRLMSEINNTNTRMPAIVHCSEYDTWLKGSVREAKALLRTYPQERMLTHPVSPRLNSLKYDDEGLVRALREG